MTFPIAPPADGPMMTILSGSNRATTSSIISRIESFTGLGPDCVVRAR